jgi:uncharacterized protein YndB with AHSA1/START domain
MSSDGRHPGETLEESVRVDAPPEAVWSLVGDPAHYSRWSPMTARTLVLDRPLSTGSRLLNLNRKGLRFWPSRAVVTAYEPGRLIAFRVRENWTTWSYTVAPEGDGTRLTLRRDAAEGISRLSTRLQNAVLGGEEAFTRALRAGIHQSLARIRAEAEG